MIINIYLVVVVGLLLAEYFLSLAVELLNLRCLSPGIPDEFQGWYDPEKYRQSQRYLRENTRFDILTSSIMTPILLAFILLGGFGWVDHLARAAGYGLIPTGLIFAGLLALGSRILHLPLDLYSTFVIEERYGFNKTTPRTYAADWLKELLLTVLIGGPVLAGILWFFAESGPLAWLYAWGALTVLQLILIYVAPVVILPLFNKFTPLAEGSLKEAISQYARDQGFALRGIFSMDGSKRSTKANAYFTGFGRWRRVVLFDTLIQKHTTDELVSVLAHEVGHYKLRHIQKHLISSVVATGLMFFILSRFISEPGLYAAFRLDFKPVGGSPPIYGGMVVFGFLYAPISMLISLAGNFVSRRYEYQADRFAARTFGKPEAMISALKKLTVDQLVNLTPHPLKVFLEYGHPPMLERILALRQRQVHTAPKQGESITLCKV